MRKTRKRSRRHNPDEEEQPRKRQKIDIIDLTSLNDDSSEDDEVVLVKDAPPKSPKANDSSGSSTEKSDDDDENKRKAQMCGICLEAIELRGVLNSCHHLFCFTCIRTWAKSSNVCPVCRQRFSEIRSRDVTKDKKKKKKKAKKQRKINVPRRNFQVNDRSGGGPGSVVGGGVWRFNHSQNLTPIVIDLDEPNLSSRPRPGDEIFSFSFLLQPLSQMVSRNGRLHAARRPIPVPSRRIDRRVIHVPLPPESEEVIDLTDD